MKSSSYLYEKGTSKMKPTSTRPRLFVSTDGRGIVNHAGVRLLTDLADRLGLTGGLSEAMEATTSRAPVHDRGRMLIDVAVMLADGGTCVSDLAALRAQPELFGKVASVPTVWRVIQGVDSETLETINQARADARRVAWEAGADPGFYVLDLDATLVGSHSEKEGASPTYKKGFGFHPLLCYLDGTGEALAGMLRPGNAGSGTAADHITVLDQALSQLPVFEDDRPQDGVEIVARGDSAACSHDFVDACRSRGIRFSVGFPLTAETAKAVVGVPEEDWSPAVSADGTEEREDAEVAEVTGLVDLSAWPTGTRAICRREVPHPGAQLTFTDFDGHRFQVFLTDQTDPDIAFLEARQRGRARAEQSIADAKDSGLQNLPFSDFDANQVWLQLVLLCQDLVAWTQMLLLQGDLERAEPKRLRFALWHQAGMLAHSGRRTHLRLQASWPWARQLAQALGRLQALPLTT
jgi:hypothetical protein